jgi:hypothetical protein
VCTYAVFTGFLQLLGCQPILSHVLGELVAVFFMRFWTRWVCVVVVAVARVVGAVVGVIVVVAIVGVDVAIVRVR